MNTNKKITSFDLCLISIFVAIIAAFAQVTIPVPGIPPLTMQTFAIPLTGAVLGARKGFIASSVYLLLGAVGVPIFQGMTGGLGIIMGPTGGFLLAFPVFALIAGRASEKNKRHLIFAGLIAGMGWLFLFGGLVWPVLIVGATVQTAFIRFVLPFLPGDLIKITMVFIIAPELRKALSKIRNHK
ncbi:MAG: biotin transporter BioY [Oscillospiraceae bacterium]|nr:biotin transporter BioY [Oscillospiraceae bacterium]